MEEHTMEHLYSFWTPDKLEPRKLGDGASLEQDLRRRRWLSLKKDRSTHCLLESSRSSTPLWTMSGRSQKKTF